MTDNQIIEYIKDKNVQENEIALRHIYRTYYKMIEAFVIKNSGTKDDAQDVFQDSILALYNNIKDGKYSQESQLSTYIFSISKNVWFNVLRKNGRINLIENKEFENNESDEDIEGMIEFTELQKQIGALLHKVGQECSRVLKLFYFERLRMVKIAEEMNYPTEQEAKNKKYKCMKKIRALISSDETLEEQLRY